MTHGSLFSGIGGFDIAAAWMGWENVFHCEWNKFGQAVLKYHFPNAITYDDITKTDFTIHRGRIDILTGGFPCQPYSSAGKRRGKEDDRHLWPEMLRAIREIQPSWVVGENVRGLTNWNGGLVFDEVQADLEAEGYEVLPFLLPACAVNAPHRRDRIWFVAKNALHNGCTFGKPQQERAEIRQFRDSCTGDKDWVYLSEGTTTDIQSRGSQISELGESQSGQQIQARSDADRYEKLGDASDTISSGHIRFSKTTRPDFTESSRGILSDIGYNRDKVWGEVKRCSQSFCDNWSNFPTQPPVRGGNDGLSDLLDADAVLKATGGRKAESNWVKETIKAYGNAVVPQVVYEIFKAIELYELNKTP